MRTSRVRLAVRGARSQSDRDCRLGPLHRQRPLHPRRTAYLPMASRANRGGMGRDAGDVQRLSAPWRSSSSRVAGGAEDSIRHGWRHCSKPVWHLRLVGPPHLAPRSRSANPGGRGTSTLSETRPDPHRQIRHLAAAHPVSLRGKARFTGHRRLLRRIDKASRTRCLRDH